MPAKTKCLIIMAGHTAAGKTTLAKYISQAYSFPYISEGAYKRQLIDEYHSENSMDESLRDRGYRIAIEKCAELLPTSKGVVLDASFHRSIRRKWVYDTFHNIDGLNIIWINCNCPDVSEVRRRLETRERATNKTADNQADKFYIYEYIKSTFETLNITEFDSLGTAIIEINTELNTIEKTIYNELFLCDERVRHLCNTVVPQCFHSLK